MGTTRDHHACGLLCLAALVALITVPVEAAPVTSEALQPEKADFAQATSMCPQDNDAVSDKAVPKLLKRSLPSDEEVKSECSSKADVYSDMQSDPDVKAQFCILDHSDFVSNAMHFGKDGKRGRFFENNLKGDQRVIDTVLDAYGDTKTFINVGANLGYHSLVSGAKHPDTQVVAFECNPEVADVFLRSVKLNSLSNVAVYQNGVSNSHNVVSMKVKHSNVGGGFLHDSKNSKDTTEYKQGDQERFNFDVDLIKLPDVDEVAKANGPFFLFMDTEGHEANVLSGMTEYLDPKQRGKTYAKFIFMEFTPDFTIERFGCDPAVQLRVLSDYGYTVVDRKEGKLDATELESWVANKRDRPNVKTAADDKKQVYQTDLFLFREDEVDLVKHPWLVKGWDVPGAWKMAETVIQEQDKTTEEKPPKASQAEEEHDIKEETPSSTDSVTPTAAEAAPTEAAPAVEAESGPAAEAAAAESVAAEPAPAEASPAAPEPAPAEAAPAAPEPAPVDTAETEPAGQS